MGLKDFFGFGGNSKSADGTSADGQGAAPTGEGIDFLNAPSGDAVAASASPTVPENLEVNQPVPEATQAPEAGSPAPAEAPLVTETPAVSSNELDTLAQQAAQDLKVEGNVQVVENPNLSVPTAAEALTSPVEPVGEVAPEPAAPTAIDPTLDSETAK